MVCLGFKAPDFIDPKFLDPKYALAEVDAAAGNGEEGGDPNVTSLKKLLNPSKKSRGGYESTKDNLLYEEIDFYDFLEAEDPYPFLTTCNKFIYDKTSVAIMDKHKAVLKPPKDLEEIITDLKVLGRREFQHLLKLRHRY